MTRFTAAISLCLLAICTANSPADTKIQQLAKSLQDNPRPETALSLLPEIGALLQDKDAVAETLPLVERAAQILQSAAGVNGEHMLAARLYKIAARLRFERAETQQAAAHCQSLLAVYRSMTEQMSPTNRSSVQASWEEEAALEYLRGGMLEDSLTLLGEIADRGELLYRGSDEMTSAVAGALNRQLDQLRTNQRYDILHAWTMPTATRRSVRMFHSLASVESPPDVFARALGERPRAGAFPIPQVGGVEGLFSSGWQLVRAAAESGRLKRLTTELESLAKEKVPRADELLLLARIADVEANGDSLQPLIDPFVEADQARNAPPAATAVGGPPVVAVPAASDELWLAVVAAGCLERPDLQAVGQRVFEALLQRRGDRLSGAMRPFLRRARAVAILRQHPGASTESLANPGLKLWIPASEEDAARSAAGAVRESWLLHEDHLLHLAGPHNDYLCFRYPLQGNFEFDVEAQNGGVEHTFGSVAFNGLAYGVAGNADEVRVWGLDMRQMLKRSFPFVRKEAWPTYQRLKIRSSDQGVELIVNGHPVWKDALTESTSPWLALRCFGDYIPAFRNFQLTGTPRIAPEIQLTQGDLMRGWFSQFYPCVTSRAAPLVEENAIGVEAVAGQLERESAVTLDWSMQDGVIQGAKSAEILRSAVPRRLAYFRPLQSGESISYEFLHEQGQQEVHPALGRLAFLLEKNGVRVRWLTSGDQEWTGLFEDNATIEPLNRRGPRPLPLKPGEWNQVTMNLAGDQLSLTLNGVEVYSRAMEPDNSRRFSLYYDASRSAARVRQVVMRGDWPEVLPENDRQRLLQTVTSAKAGDSQATTRPIGRLLGDRHLDDAALFVHRRARSLSAEERFAMLSRFVLPGPAHERLRLSLDFSPTDPPPTHSLGQRTEHEAAGPSADSQHTGAGHETADQQNRGGEIVSPAWDLIQTAGELGRLDEVRRQVEAAPAASDLEQRQRLAMLALTDLARGESASANELLFQLFSLVEKGTHISFPERWPETLAAWGALQHQATLNVGRELTVFLHQRQARNGADSGSEAWRRHITALLGRYQELQKREPAAGELEKQGDEGRRSPPIQLSQWTVVSRETATTRGSGFPPSRWQADKSTVDVLARHEEDYLYFQSPLQGNYEVECNVPAFGWRDTALMAAGEWVAERYDLKTFWRGNFRQFLAAGKVSPPFVRPTNVIHYRIVVHDGEAQYFANGRLMYQRPVDSRTDPWLAIRSETPGLGGAWNVLITGRPEIPASIAMIGGQDLGGWAPYFSHQTVNNSGGNWQYVEDGMSHSMILGRQQPEPTAMGVESLLRYHRPMLEDGTIEYEFYYRPGKALCHPALDRLALLIDPGGIQEHWITDGRHERNDVSAVAAIDQPENRRGPTPLPLTADSWNRLALTLRGAVLQLTLNGQLVYERTLENGNRRTFGLFHYADQSEAVVRNLVWSGNWPRLLPSLADQELVGDYPFFLDETIADLPARFDHDFRRDGFPMDKFLIVHGTNKSFVPAEDGLQIHHQGRAGYQNATIAPKLQIVGDFDITATYERLDTESAVDGSASLYLMGIISSEQPYECMVMRRHSLHKRGADEHFYQTAVVLNENGQQRRSYSRAITTENKSGRLRLARRGKHVYHLVAEGDSHCYQLIRTDELPGGEIDVGNLRVINQTHGPGRLNVVWTSLSVRAQSLDGAAIVKGVDEVEQLDERRKALPVRLFHDFAKHSITPEKFYHWGFELPKQVARSGLRIAGPPNDKWVSAGLAPQLPLRGDFDISFEFNVLHMTTPKEQLNSAVYLQIEIPDKDQRQYSAIFMGTADGSRYASAQVRGRRADGSYSYESFGRAFADQIHRLRLARRANRIYVLFSENATQRDRLVGSYEIEPLDLPPGAVKLLVHTGGSDRRLEADWKRVTLQSE